MVADLCFTSASSTAENGFIGPKVYPLRRRIMLASRAVARIGRYLNSPQIPDSPVAFLDSCRDHRTSAEIIGFVFGIEVMAPEFLAITTPTTCRIFGKKILRFMFRHRRYSLFFEVRADLAWVARSMSGGGCCSPAIAHQTPT